MWRVVAVLVTAWSSVASADEAPTRVVGELSLDGGAFYAPQLDSREWRQLYGLGVSVGGEFRPPVATLLHAVVLEGRDDLALFVGGLVLYRIGHARLGGGAGLSAKITNLGDDHGLKHDSLGLGTILKAEVVQSAFALGVELNVDVLPTVSGADFSAPWPMFMFTFGVGRY